MDKADNENKVSGDENKVAGVENKEEKCDTEDSSTDKGLKVSTNETKRRDGDNEVNACVEDILEKNSEAEKREVIQTNDDEEKQEDTEKNCDEENQEDIEKNSGEEKHECTENNSDEDKHECMEKNCDEEKPGDIEKNSDEEKHEIDSCVHKSDNSDNKTQVRERRNDKTAFSNEEKQETEGFDNKTNDSEEEKFNTKNCSIKTYNSEEETSRSTNSPESNEKTPTTSDGINNYANRSESVDGRSSRSGKIKSAEEASNHSFDESYDYYENESGSQISDYQTGNNTVEVCNGQDRHTYHYHEHKHGDEINGREKKSTHGEYETSCQHRKHREYDYGDYCNKHYDKSSRRRSKYDSENSYHERGFTTAAYYHHSEPKLNHTNTYYTSYHQSTAVDEHYSYIPATDVFLKDGTLSPKYLPLFTSAFFMFKKSAASWIHNAVHIFGVRVDPKALYQVFLPQLNTELIVEGSTICPNPNEPDPVNPRSFYVKLPGQTYVGTRLRSANKNSYDADNHRHKLQNLRHLVHTQSLNTGSSFNYVKSKDSETLKVFGVPIYKTQSYYVYVPLYNTEYAVLGGAISPNPSNSNTMLVTIDRVRHEATTVRPCFPELVFKEKNEKTTKMPSGRTSQHSTAPPPPPRQPIKSVYGVPVNLDNTYHIYIPELKKEVVDFGRNIFVNEDDNDTVIVCQDGMDLVGTCVRPAFLKNNDKYGDKDVIVVGGKLNANQEQGKEDKEDKAEDKEVQSRYKLVAYGVPVNNDIMYDVTVSEIDANSSEKTSSNASDLDAAATNPGTMTTATTTANPGDMNTTNGNSGTMNTTNGNSGTKTTITTSITSSDAVHVGITSTGTQDPKRGEVRTQVVSGRDIHYNNHKTITVTIGDMSHVVTGIRKHGDDAVLCAHGEVFELKPVMIAFGIPIVSSHNYQVLVPVLKCQMLVKGYTIHQNPLNENTVLVIISGLQLIGTHITTSKDLITPTYRVGTVIQSDSRAHQTELQLNSDGGSDSQDGRNATIAATTSNTLPVKSANAAIPPPPPGDIGLELTLEVPTKPPKYIINNVAIYDEKKYCVYSDYGNYIVKGSSFKPYHSDQRFFNFKIQEDLVLFVENRYVISTIADGPKGPKKLKPCQESAFSAPVKAEETKN